MDDYKTIDVEYNNLNNWVESKINDISIIKEKIKVFKKNIIALKAANVSLFMCFFISIINPQKRKELAEFWFFK